MMINMEELVKKIIEWIIDNIGLLIFVGIAISITIPISIHFGKNITINNKNINNKNINNNYDDTKKKNNLKNNTRTTKPNWFDIELISIHLYSTSKKGKIITETFYKLINHNFGIEVAFKNKNLNSQNVKMKWHIYKGNKRIHNKVFYAKVKGNNIYRGDFYIKPQEFNKMKNGKYQSVFFVKRHSDISRQLL